MCAGSLHLEQSLLARDLHSRSAALRVLYPFVRLQSVAFLPSLFRCCMYLVVRHWASLYTVWIDATERRLLGLTTVQSAGWRVALYMAAACTDLQGTVYGCVTWA